MKYTCIKTLTLFFIILLSTRAHATKDTEMAAFFAQKNNQKNFEMARSSGKIKKSREFMLNICHKAKKTNKEADCNCYDSELKKFSDKEFFYESVLAFQQYQQATAALKDGDNEKYKAIKKKQANQKNLSQRLEKNCGTLEIPESGT